MSSLKDVQKKPDYRGITIQKVGVKKAHLPLLILTENNDYQRVLGDVSICSDLTHKYRGVHMSRFMEILNRWSSKHMSSKQLKEILDEVCKKLESERSQISVHFKYFLKKNAPITGSTGFIDYDCEFYGLMSGTRYSFILGAAVPVQLVCPCSKEISKYGAHNQRADIQVRLEYFPGEFIWLEELIKTVEEAGSTDVFPVIKREDEKEITERAFENPKFVEDALRQLVEKFRNDSRIRWFEVECESYESIHNHNAFAYQMEMQDDRDRSKGLIPFEDLHLIRKINIF